MGEGMKEMHDMLNDQNNVEVNYTSKQNRR